MVDNRKGTSLFSWLCENNSWRGSQSRMSERIKAFVPSASIFLFWVFTWSLEVPVWDAARYSCRIMRKENYDGAVGSHTYPNRIIFLKWRWKVTCSFSIMGIINILLSWSAFSTTGDVVNCKLPHTVSMDSPYYSTIRTAIRQLLPVVVLSCWREI